EAMARATLETHLVCLTNPPPPRLSVRPKSNSERSAGAAAPRLPNQPATRRIGRPNRACGMHRGNSKAGCKQASGKALKVPSCWAGSLSGVRADDGREAAEHLQSCSEAQNYSITLIDGIARTPTTTRRGGIPPQRVLR